MEIQALIKQIESSPAVMLYFSGEQCNVCHALRPKIKALFDEKFPKIAQVWLDAHEHPQIAAHFHVFSVPTLIVFLDGREFVREGRAMSLAALEEKIARPYALLTE